MSAVAAAEKAAAAKAAAVALHAGDIGILQKLLLEHGRPGDLVQPNLQAPVVRVEEAEVIHKLKKLGTVVEVEGSPIIPLPLVRNEVTSDCLKRLEKMVKCGEYGDVSVNRPLFVGKDISVSLASEPIDQHPPTSLFEPLIDIVEGENHLANDGTFSFKTDSFHSVELPKCYSCDVCSAVYQHSHMLRKHYMRLHVARKYISEKDMEHYNIDPEPDLEEPGGEKLIFRCHTCRRCFCGKAELKSHLMDHPPVTEIRKQTTRQAKQYKCVNCETTFKWRKLYGKHKKTCKPAQLEEKSRPPQYHCLYCNETFFSANKKKNHILSLHPYCRKRHPCVFCRDTYTTHAALFCHLVTEHAQSYYACKSCKERFARVDQLDRHNLEKHYQQGELLPAPVPRQPLDTDLKEYYGCTTCDKMFLVEMSLQEHADNCPPAQPPTPIQSPGGEEVTPPPAPPPKMRRTKSQNSKSGVDPETLFYSTVAGNIRDNLLHHLDGKLQTPDPATTDTTDTKSRKILNFSAGFSSLGQVLNGDQEKDPSAAGKPPPKAPWEKYTFPKNYDGRCGLTSYIKDTSYLDISTQLIMRRNLQRLNMLPCKETHSDDVPTVLSLERLGAQCAESFGEVKPDSAPPDHEVEENSGEEVVELSGEWVRDRTYVCSVCGWETPCLWTMEDHKYNQHQHVLCPQHELVGEDRHLSKLIYTRLVANPPQFGPKKPIQLPAASEAKCTKCGEVGFTSAAHLHRHIMECAGEDLAALGLGGNSSSGCCGVVRGPRQRRWRSSRKRRSTRRGLKRNIPSTPQRPPVKLRTKPGDTDTIQKMIANLPAKRVTRRVIGFDEVEIKTRSQATIQNAPSTIVVHKTTSKPSKPKQQNKQAGDHHNNHSHHHHHHQRAMLGVGTHSSDHPVKRDMAVAQLHKVTDLIDTSAEHGNVLSSLRMMPVKPPHKENATSSKQEIKPPPPPPPPPLPPQSTTIKNKDSSSQEEGTSAVTSTTAKTPMCTGCGVHFESNNHYKRHRKNCVYYRESKVNNVCKSCGVSFPFLMALLDHTCGHNNKETQQMPKLEIEKDLAPVNSAEIPVLSPVAETSAVPPPAEQKPILEIPKPPLLVETSKIPEDSFIGISFVNGKIKYETLSSVSLETEKLKAAKPVRRTRSSPQAPTRNGPVRKRKMTQSTERDAEKTPETKRSRNRKRTEEPPPKKRKYIRRAIKQNVEIETGENKENKKEEKSGEETPAPVVTPPSASAQEEEPIKPKRKPGRPFGSCKRKSLPIELSPPVARPRRRTTMRSQQELAASPVTSPLRRTPRKRRTVIPITQIKQEVVEEDTVQDQVDNSNQDEKATLEPDLEEKSTNQDHDTSAQENSETGKKEEEVEPIQNDQEEIVDTKTEMDDSKTEEKRVKSPRKAPVKRKLEEPQNRRPRAKRFRGFSGRRRRQQTSKKQVDEKKPVNENEEPSEEKVDQVEIVPLEQEPPAPSIADEKSSEEPLNTGTETVSEDAEIKDEEVMKTEVVAQNKQDEEKQVEEERGEGNVKTEIVSEDSQPAEVREDDSKNKVEEEEEEEEIKSKSDEPKSELEEPEVTLETVQVKEEKTQQGNNEKKEKGKSRDKRDRLKRKLLMLDTDASSSETQSETGSNSGAGGVVETLRKLKKRKERLAKRAKILRAAKNFKLAKLKKKELEASDNKEVIKVGQFKWEVSALNRFSPKKETQEQEEDEEEEEEDEEEDEPEEEKEETKKEADKPPVRAESPEQGGVQLFSSPEKESQTSEELTMTITKEKLKSGVNSSTPTTTSTGGECKKRNSGVLELSTQSCSEDVTLALPSRSDSPPVCWDNHHLWHNSHSQSHSTSTSTPAADPSLGTILDSVNKLLSEPESTYTPLGLPQYSLADLQKAMGASDAEMAVLQQLGEDTLQVENNKEEDDWNETCIMDLDNQSSQQQLKQQQLQQQNMRQQENNQQHEEMMMSTTTPSNSNTTITNTTGGSSTTTTGGHQLFSNFSTLSGGRCSSSSVLGAAATSSLMGMNSSSGGGGGVGGGGGTQQQLVQQQTTTNQQHLHLQPSLKQENNMVSSSVLSGVRQQQQLKGMCSSSSSGSNNSSSMSSSNGSLLAAHSGKEVVCPTCSCHFMGFPALQLHVNKVHTDQPNSSVSMLNRRVVLESGKESRLICFVCQQILPSNLMCSHLVVEHSLKSADITKCTSLTGESHNYDGSVGGERLKSKMSSALDDLLERAVNNLLRTGSKLQLSGGAVSLLTKLCEIRQKEAASSPASQQHRLHPLARELLIKQLRQDGSSSTGGGGEAGVRGDEAGVGGTMSSASSASSPAHHSSSTPPPAVLPPAKPHQKPFGCTICGQKFRLPSWRSRHVVVSHTKTRTSTDEKNYSELFEYENDWRDDAGSSRNDDSGGEQSGGDNDSTSSSSHHRSRAVHPLCSECGLSFRSVKDMTCHRMEYHLRRKSTDSVASCSSQPSASPSASASASASRRSSIDTPPPSPSPIPQSKELCCNHAQPSGSRSPDVGSNNKPNKKSLGRKSAAGSSKTVWKTTTAKKRSRSQHLEEEESVDDPDHDTEEESSLSTTTGHSSTMNDTVNEYISSEPEVIPPGVSETLSSSRKKPGRPRKRGGGPSSSPPPLSLPPPPAPAQTTIKNSKQGGGSGRRYERKKIRLTHIGEESVREKAEAALRELNLPKKPKDNCARWTSAMTFTKNNNSPPGGTGSIIQEPIIPQLPHQSTPSPIETPPDVYDFSEENNPFPLNHN